MITVQTAAKPVEKVKWKNFIYRNQNLKYFEEIPIKNKNIKNLSLSTKWNSPSDFTLMLKNEEGIPIGTEDVYAVRDFCDGNYLFGSDIKISENLRGQNLGDTLRLGTIMMMLKNKFSSIKIESIANAIPFHHRNKFTTDITNFPEAKSALKHLKDSDKEGFESLKQEAKEIFSSLKPSEYELSPESYRKVKDFLKRYFDKCLANGQRAKEPILDNAVRLELTAQDIKASRTYFNKLFMSNGIDYKV